MNAERHARTHHPFAIRHSSAENYTHSWQMFTEEHYIIIASLYFFFSVFVRLFGLLNTLNEYKNS